MPVINDPFFISRRFPYGRQFLGRQHGIERCHISRSSLRTVALWRQDGVGVVNSLTPTEGASGRLFVPQTLFSVCMNAVRVFLICQFSFDTMMNVIFIYFFVKPFQYPICCILHMCHRMQYIFGQLFYSKLQLYD